MRPPILYYRARRFFPRPLQVGVRRAHACIRRRATAATWPIDQLAGDTPRGFLGWPEGKRFALVLRHDVESRVGAANALRLAAVEESRGLRSAFYFVPRGYGDTGRIRSILASRGFEIGVHGLTHDGLLYASHQSFLRCSTEINDFLNDWQSVGFASPSSHHEFEWLHELDIEYDTSSFDTDPFEPQPDGIRTIFPVSQWDQQRKHLYIELPYTFAQDFTVFVILGHKDTALWTRKLDWIVDHGGMALLVTHPDYVVFPGDRRRSFTYDLGLYERFLDYVRQRYGDSCWYALPRDVARYWRDSVATQTEPPRNRQDVR